MAAEGNLRACRYLVVALAALALAARGGQAAEWRLFLPRSVDHGAALDLFASSESDEITETVRPTRWSDDFVKAKLTLFSEGYVYHPRFLVYRASLGGAIKREAYEDTGMPDMGWRQASGLEYDAQVTLLPEHSYNLTLFARRVEPLVRERASTLLQAVDTSFGAFARYRRRPWFGSAGFTDNSIETGRDITNIRKLDVNGQYHREMGGGSLVSFSATFAPTRFHNNRGFSGDSTEATLGNVLERGGLRLASNVSRSDFEQRSKIDGSYGSTQFQVREQFTAALGKSLRGRFDYRYHDTDSRSSEGGAERRLESRGHEAEAGIVHRLYDSLESSYTVRYGTQESTAGNSEQLSHELGESYTKRIPSGRLQANLGASRSVAENRGRADVIREGHQAVAVPGSFQLVRPNVRASTLQVYVRSPLAPFEAVLLAENMHYTVQQVGPLLEVRVLALPAPFVVPGSFTFEVSYSMLSGRFSLLTESLSHGASVDLLASRISPFYSFMRVRSEVRDGIVPGFLPDSTTWTVGVRSLYGPVRARVQYQDVRWDGSPYTAKEAEVQYVGAVGLKANLFASLSYVDRDYKRTAAAHAGRAYRETIESASANYQRHCLNRSLTFTAGGGYTRIRSLVDTRGITWNGSIAWSIGKLSLSAGASSYESESEGPAFAAPRRLHRYYFLRLNRRLD